MKTALDLIGRKVCLFKNFRIWKKVNTGSGLFCLSKSRKQSIYQFNGRHSTFKPVMMNITFPTDFHIQISRQRIHYRRTYSVQTTAGLIIAVVKFSSGVKCGKYQTFCRHTFFMHTHRNTTSVILYCGRTILFQTYKNPVTLSGQMFIYRIIHDLIYQMIQSLAGNASNVHTGSLSNRFQSLQHGYTCCIIDFLLCHTATPFLNPILLCQKKLPLIS